MSTEDIYNYRRVDDETITGGQPTPEQLAAAAAEGVVTVINLAPADAHNALPDEATRVRALGMAYVHIPVDWQNPQERDLEAFAAAMAERRPGKTLIHCAANYRVTAFYSLYALEHLGWTVEEAEAFRASVWSGSDYPVWEAFYARLRDRIGRPGASRDR